MNWPWRFDKHSVLSHEGLHCLIFIDRSAILFENSNLWSLVVYIELNQNISSGYSDEIVEPLIRRRVLWRLIRVCTIRLIVCPTNRTLGMHGLTTVNWPWRFDKHSVLSHEGLHCLIFIDRSAILFENSNLWSLVVYIGLNQNIRTGFSDRNCYYAPNFGKIEGAYCFRLVRVSVQNLLRYNFERSSSDKA